MLQPTAETVRFEANTGPSMIGDRGKRVMAISAVVDGIMCVISF